MNSRSNTPAPDRYLSRFYPESRFGGFTDVDGTIAFYSHINALLQPSFVVIDFGCGRGAHCEDTVPFRRELRRLKGKVANVIGLDVDEAGKQNPTVDEFRSIAGSPRWPVDDHSVDLIVCDSVMEHLPDPDLFFREAKRVLVPGGFICLRTPNALSYVGIVSRLVPNAYHDRVLAKAQLGRKEEDVFPTLYRCNTVRAVKRQFARHGFEGVVYGHEAEPSYLYFSKLMYAIGVVHQRLAPAFMSPSIFAFAQSVGA
jgi:SAM-dependent methyltransferase